MASLSERPDGLPRRPRRRFSRRRLARRGVAVSLFTVIVTLTGMAMRHDYTEARTVLHTGLDTIAGLQARLVAHGLEDRMSQAQYISGSTWWARDYDQWRRQGDPALRALLSDRLAGLGRAFGPDTVLLLNDQSEVVLGRWGGQPLSAPLRAAVQRALTTGQIERTEPYKVQGQSGSLRMDVIAPLVGHGATAQAVVVFHFNPVEQLEMVPTSSELMNAASVQLTFKQGSNTLVGAAGEGMQSLSDSELPAARVLRVESPADTTIEGRDYAGRPVIAVVVPVPGTDWLLTAQIGRDSFYADLWRDQALIMGMGLLALFGAGVACFLSRERRALATARADRAAQEDRLRALGLMQAIADSSSDAIFAKDVQGRYLMCNHEMARILGHGAEEFIGRDDRVFFRSEQAAVIMANDQRVISEGTVLTFEEEVSTVDGLRTFLVTKGVLRDDQGRVAGMYGIARDISQRKQAEAALQESEAAVRAILASMSDGMFIAQDRTFVFVNAALPAMLGYTPEAFIGLPFDQVIGPEHIDRWIERYELRISGLGEPPRQYELQMRTRDGNALVWVELRANRFMYRGRPAVLGLIRDMTERRQADLALRDAYDLVQAVEDSLPEQMAVLDAQGVIVEVNASWHEFSARHGVMSTDDSRLGIGVNYLDVCRSATGRDSEGAAAVAAGIAAVLEKRQPLFKHEYACLVGRETRWYSMRVTPLQISRGGAVVVHADITHRHLTENALRDREALYRSMITALDEGILVVGIDGVVKACNTHAERFFGVELLNRPFALATEEWQPLRANGTLLPTVDRPIQQSLSSGRSSGELLLGMQHPQRGLRWLRVNVEPVYDDQTQKMSAVVTSFSDITESHLAEQTLRKLSMAVEQSPASIVISDTHDRIEYVNAAFSRITGFTAEEAVGQLRQILQPDRLDESTYRAKRNVLLGGGVWSAEVRARRKDGEPYDELVRAAPIRLPDGTISHFLSLGEDITAHKRVEAELDQHRHHLQELVDQRTSQLQELNNALVDSERFIHTVADSQPGLLAYWNRDLQCQFANRAYRDWFDCPEGALSRLSPDVLLHGEWQADQHVFLDDVLAGESKQVQRVLVANDGRVLHGLVTVTPDVVDGVVRGFLALVSDITEIKQAELRLREVNAALMDSRDKAEAANRAKSAFLANMSHEIRTPMNAIIGWTHLLQRDAHQSVDAERLGKIADAARHLLQVINDILDLSKIEADKVELEDIDFSLRNLLKRTRDLVVERAHAKGLTLSIDCDGVPDALRGDPTRLSQALLNLLSNAVKFTDDGDISVSVTLVERTDESMLIRFAVLDSGVGIPQDVMGHLFQAFEQADTSTTRRFGGTGLGLALTKRLAAMMGGEVGVHSAVGEGSEFWFSARLTKALAELPETPDDVGAAESILMGRGGQARLLLVEDNPVNRELALELLRAVGLHADVAVDGVEAVDYMRQQSCDLILMDLQMPRMDGLKAARHIRILPYGRSVPIIAMTASAFSEDRAACLASGMNDHVAKPVDPATLYAVLQRWLPQPVTVPVCQVHPVPVEGSSDIPVLSGIDTRRGLSYVGGRADVYRRVLRQFERHYGDHLDAMAHSLSTEPLTAVRASAHSLKGASATIGATRLSQLAGELEASAAAEQVDRVAEQRVSTLRELELIVAVIREHLGELQSGLAPLEVESIDLSQLNELEHWLDSGDYRAVGEFRRVAPFLRQQFGLPVADIGEALNQFDYERALNLLRALRVEVLR